MQVRLSSGIFIGFQGAPAVPTAYNGAPVDAGGGLGLSGIPRVGCVL